VGISASLPDGVPLLTCPGPPATTQWCRAVVKHEAFALRRQRERHSPITNDGQLGDRPTPAAITHDQTERREWLRHAAEALHQLKPQEIRALQLKALGYSYREICQLTDWTYTNL
jgi:DNA-directed RNA polymerase specialized sigma24 family protein